MVEAFLFLGEALFGGFEAAEAVAPAFLGLGEAGAEAGFGAGLGAEAGFGAGAFDGLTAAEIGGTAGDELGLGALGLEGPELSEGALGLAGQDFVPFNPEAVGDITQDLLARGFTPQEAASITQSVESGGLTLDQLGSQYGIYPYYEPSGLIGFGDGGAGEGAGAAGEGAAGGEAGAAGGEAGAGAGAGEGGEGGIGSDAAAGGDAGAGVGGDAGAGAGPGQTGAEAAAEAIGEATTGNEAGPMGLGLEALSSQPATVADVTQDVGAGAFGGPGSQSTAGFGSTSSATTGAAAAGPAGPAGATESVEGFLGAENAPTPGFGDPGVEQGETLGARSTESLESLQASTQDAVAAAQAQNAANAETLGEVGGPETFSESTAFGRGGPTDVGRAAEIGSGFGESMGFGPGFGSTTGTTEVAETFGVASSPPSPGFVGENPTIGPAGNAVADTFGNPDVMGPVDTLSGPVASFTGAAPGVEAGPAAVAQADTGFNAQAAASGLADVTGAEPGIDAGPETVTGNAFSPGSADEGFSDPTSFGTQSSPGLQGGPTSVAEAPAAISSDQAAAEAAADATQDAEQDAEEAAAAQAAGQSRGSIGLADAPHTAETEAAAGRGVATGAGTGAGAGAGGGGGGNLFSASNILAGSGLTLAALNTLRASAAGPAGLPSQGQAAAGQAAGLQNVAQSREALALNFGITPQEQAVLDKQERDQMNAAYQRLATGGTDPNQDTRFVQMQADIQQRIFAQQAQLVTQHFNEAMAAAGLSLNTQVALSSAQQAELAAFRKAQQDALSALASTAVKVGAITGGGARPSIAV